MLLLLAGCNASESEPIASETTPACLPPTRLVGSACLEPGVQDNGCPAGALGLEDGSCLPAGVVACADGFVHEGDGCEPILPAAPCAKGTMAVPGDAACRAVMPCGSGKWGDLPVDGTTEHVDGSYTGASSDGSAAAPWTTVGAAVSAAAPGALVAVAEGSYLEAVTISGKPVRLWGVCPEKVEIVGPDTELDTLVVTGASGAEVGGLAITGLVAYGVFVSGSSDVVLDRLWVHDVAGRGIDLEDSLGTTSVRVTDTLVEQCVDIGTYVAGAEVTVERSVVRGTLPSMSDQRFGRGLSVHPGPISGSASQSAVRSSLVEQNREVGVAIVGSEIDLEGSVVRGTLPQAADQRLGRGIEVRRSETTGVASIALVRGSLIDRNHEAGAIFYASETTIEGTVVRGTLPQAADGLFGAGVVVEGSATVEAPSTAVVRASLVEKNHDLGMFILGSDATVESTVVRGTLPQAFDQSFGSGIGIQSNPATTTPSTAVVRASVVADNHDHGMFIFGANVTVEGTIVSRTLLQTSDQRWGRGIGIQSNPETGAPSTVVLRASLVEQSHDVGVYVSGSEVSLLGVAVREVEVDGRGLFGDAVAVFRQSGPAHAVIESSLLTQARRAGVSNFGAVVNLEATVLRCHAFDLDGEIYLGNDYMFHDQGHNQCGCPSADASCTVASTGLMPPEPVPAD